MGKKWSILIELSSLASTSHTQKRRRRRRRRSNNKQTWTVRKPVRMGKIPITKKWDQKIEEGIEKISKSTDYRGLLISTGFQCSLTFNHQEIQLNSQIQIAHVKCAHGYTSVISINISLINRLHTFLPKWRLTPSRNSNSFQNFTLPSKWSHRRDLRRSGVKENDYDSNNSTLSQMRQLIIISKFDNKNFDPQELTPNYRPPTIYNTFQPSFVLRTESGPNYSGTI